MNNKYIVFFILAVLIIAFLWNKNEHADTTTDNITAKNIKASGDIDASGNVKAKYIGATEAVSAPSIYAGYQLITPQLHVKDKSGEYIKTFALNDGTNRFVSVGGTLISKGLCVGGTDTCVNEDLVKKIIGVANGVRPTIISPEPISNEAIQNIASVYNNNNFTATNINASNNLTANNLNTGDITSRSNVKAKYINATDAIGAPSIYASYQLETPQLLVKDNSGEYIKTFALDNGKARFVNVPTLNATGVCFDGLCLNKDVLVKLILAAQQVLKITI